MADAGDKEKPAQPKKKTKAKGDAAPEGTTKKAKAADGKAAKAGKDLALAAVSSCLLETRFSWLRWVLLLPPAAVEAEEEPEKPVVSLKGLLARECELLGAAVQLPWPVNIAAWQGG